MLESYINPRGDWPYYLCFESSSGGINSVSLGLSPKHYIPGHEKWTVWFFQIFALGLPSLHRRRVLRAMGGNLRIMDVQRFSMSGLMITALPEDREGGFS